MSTIERSRFYHMVHNLYQQPQFSGLATHRQRGDFLYRSNETGVPLLYHWHDLVAQPVCLTPGDNPISGYVALHAHRPTAMVAQDEGGSENYRVCKLDFGRREILPVTPDPLGRLSQIIWLDDATWIVVGGDMQDNWIKLLTEDGATKTLFRSDRWLFHAQYDAVRRHLFFEASRGPSRTNVDIGVLNVRHEQVVHWLSESDDSEETQICLFGDRLAYTTDLNRESTQVVIRSLDDWQRVAQMPAPGEVSSLSWLDDRTLLATVEQNATSLPRLLHFEASVGSNGHRWSAPLGHGSTWRSSLTAQGPVWAASALDRPAGLYRAVNGAVEELLSPASLAALIPGESIWYSSFDGKQVQGWLLRQPKPDAGLVVYVHGGPSSVTLDMWRVEIQALAQAGFHVFAPNYRGSTSFGADFRLANIGDLGGGDAQDVLCGAKHAAKLLGLDSLPAITGRSYGGYLTLHALTTQPDEWAGGVAVVPVADWVEDYRLLDAGFRFFDVYFFEGTPDEKPELYRERSPLTHLDRLRAPTLILHGENDSRCPIEPVIHFAAEAKRKGLPVELIITRDEGHGNQQLTSAVRDSVLTLEHLMGLW